MSLIQSLKLNEKGNDYVVGDIHGCFTLLQKNLDDIKFNPEVDRLFCVGDLVDRGRESEESINWLAKDWFFCVRGNHEDMAIEFYQYCEYIGDEEKDVRYVNNYTQNGGAWFIALPVEEKRKFHDAFINLPLVIDIETSSGLVGITHASTHFPDWNTLSSFLSDESALEYNHEEDWNDFFQDLIWNRDLIKYGDPRVIENVYKVYHGHTPTNKIVELGNRVYIDTGAVWTGQLQIIKL